MPTGDFKCPICQEYNCNVEHGIHTYRVILPPPLFSAEEPIPKDLEFLSWGDYGFHVFDQFGISFKIQALVDLQFSTRLLVPKFVFATINNDGAMEDCATYEASESRPYHISSEVWVFDGISYFYKTLEEAKDAIRSEYKKFVRAFYK